MSPNAEDCGCDYGLNPPWLCERHRKRPAAVPEQSAWIGVDLDGTLATYPHSFPEIGPPIQPMVRRVLNWLVDGKDVRIFTARVAIIDGLRNTEGQEADTSFADEQLLKIQAWCQEHLGMVLPVTATKDFCMVELWDDRCVQLVTNTGRRVDEFTPEQLIDQRCIGHGEGQLHALQDVLTKLPRVRVAVPDPPFVKMEDVIRVADIEALVPR